jgi:hypothetical protein
MKIDTNKHHESNWSQLWVLNSNHNKGTTITIIQYKIYCSDVNNDAFVDDDKER